MYKPKFIKPKLVGGSPPPYGLLWKIFAISQHHLNLISALCNHRKQLPSEIISSALSFYSAHYRTEVDQAFLEFPKRFTKEGKMLHPFAPALQEACYEDE